MSLKQLALVLVLVLTRCGGGGTLALAQSCPSGYTRIADTVAGPVAPSTGLPTLFFGTVTITPNSPGTGAGGQTFGRVPLALTVQNGILSVCLIPNDTATPINTVYMVRYAYVGDQGAAPPWTETWSVPTSGSPITVAIARLLTTPPMLQGTVTPNTFACGSGHIASLSISSSGVLSGTCN